MNFDVERSQKELCRKYGVVYCPSPNEQKVGVTPSVRKGAEPINGLRHPPQGDTTGWYIWAGEEFSEDPNFFEPLHVKHLSEWCPAVQKYLGLPPGWRFLIASNYEDVWYDESLLNI